jgi:hypothetical protein
MIKKINEFKLIKSNIIKLAFLQERETNKMRDLIESFLLGDFEAVSVMYRMDDGHVLLQGDELYELCDKHFEYIVKNGKIDKSFIL